MRSSREKNLAFLIGGVTILSIFVLLEIVVRLFLDVHAEPYPMDYAPISDPLFEYDPDLFWRQKPGRESNYPNMKVLTNSLGLRDDEFPKKVTGKRFWVLCLGDSPTWGDRVNNDETYPNVLERLLQEYRPDISVEVLNGGVPAYTTLQASRLEARLLESFDFDVVTINNMGSDMFPSRKMDREYERPQFSSRVFAVVSHSKLYCYLRNTILKRRRLAEKFSIEMGTRTSLEDYGIWLTGMVEVAKRDRAEVILLSPLPFSMNLLSPEENPFDALRDFILRMKETEGEYREAMKKVGERTGVKMIDFVEILRSVHDPFKLYADVVHPNPEGHRLIAEALFDEITPVLEGKFPR